MHQRLPLRPLRLLLIAVEQNTPRAFVRLRHLGARASIASMFNPLYPKGGRHDRRGPYHNSRWRRRRRYQLAQEPLCQRCKAVNLVVVADVVHHVEDHNGDPIKFWYGELESLCRDCHEREHGRANNNPWIGEDGLPLPPEQQAERERQQMAKRLWEDNDDD